MSVQRRSAARTPPDRSTGLAVTAMRVVSVEGFVRSANAEAPAVNTEQLSFEVFHLQRDHALVGALVTTGVDEGEIFEGRVVTFVTGREFKRKTSDLQRWVEPYVVGVLRQLMTTCSASPAGPWPGKARWRFRPRPQAEGEVVD